MVALATLEQLDQSEVPVVDHTGDRRSLALDRHAHVAVRGGPGATDRLPAATEYRVEVPAGTTAANGATLAEPVVWTFATPAPQVTSFSGESDSLPLEPGVRRRVRPARRPGRRTRDDHARAAGQRVALRIATAAEVDADDQARAAYASALPDRAVAFRATAALPVDADLAITIGPGTPSLEGPLTSGEPATYRPTRSARSRVVNSSCSYTPECVPGSPFTIEFSNALDTAAFDAGLVAVDPEIPGMRIDVYGNVIQIAGATAGRTTYRVTLDGSLRDVFGQTLGDDTELTFDVGPAKPTLYGLQRDWITTDPMAAAPTSRSRPSTTTTCTSRRGRSPPPT